MAVAMNPDVVSVDLDEFIRELFDCLGHSWKFLARGLDFSETDIAALEHDNPYDLKEQIHQMFYKWRRREGSGATSGKLLSAMKAAGFDEQVRILTQKGIIQAQKSSADIASSLAIGVHPPIQATCNDDAQTDSPVGLKRKTSKPDSPSAPVSTPPGELDFVRKQRIKRFASNTSDKSNPDQLASTISSPLSPNEKSDALHDGVTTTACNKLESPDDAVVVSSTNKSTFEVNDVIKVDRPESPHWYGVVKWTGPLPGISGLFAGCEMEGKVEGGGYGTFNDVSYFECPDGQGLFLPMSRLKPDDRFSDTVTPDDGPSIASGSTPKIKSADPQSVSELLSKLLMDSSRGAEPSSKESESKVYVLYIPADCAGLVIGTGGKNIREVEQLTNTSIKLVGNSGLYGAKNRKVFVKGSEENCKQALLMIMKRVKKRIDEHIAGAKTISIPENRVGKVIGKNGATISAIRAISHAQEVKIEDRTTGLQAMLKSERQCHIHGTEEAIEMAEKLIQLAVRGEDIVAAATLVAVIDQLSKMGVECEEDV